MINKHTNNFQTVWQIERNISDMLDGLLHNREDRDCCAVFPEHDQNILAKLKWFDCEYFWIYVLVLLLLRTENRHRYANRTTHKVLEDELIWKIRIKLQIKLILPALDLIFWQYYKISFTDVQLNVLFASGPLNRTNSHNALNFEIKLFWEALVLLTLI